MTSPKLPTLETGHPAVDRAYRIALNDLKGNVAPFKGGLLEEEAPVIMAGRDYDRPWTRDAAINAWNGASLLMPDVSRNTLLSVVEPDDGDPHIGGEYWDAIIWVTGAWWHYLYTEDRDFLATAMQVTRNSLAFFETLEFEPRSGLFRGPGCYGDGVSAYPDAYADAGGSSSILDWPAANAGKTAGTGRGIPMQALSTNCLYYNAYMIAGQMADLLGENRDPLWAAKAEDLKRSILARFWNEPRGHFRYLVGPLGLCDHQEALGHSFVLLCGLATESQAESVFRNQYVASAGVPCVWPTFPRYGDEEGTSFGRHCGTVWPHIQGFWASAAALFRKETIFSEEFFPLAKHACRDRQFAEVYHPVTGDMYGGLQERKGEGVVLWPSCGRQAWSATAFLRMVFHGLLGMRFNPESIRFEPTVPGAFNRISLSGLVYRGTEIDVTVHGSGTRVIRTVVDDDLWEGALPHVPGVERKRVEITVRRK